MPCMNMIEYVLYISLSLDTSRMTNRSVWIVISGDHRWHWLGSRDTNHETFSIIIARHGICHCTWFIMRDLCKSICRSYVGEIQHHLSIPEDLMLQNATSLRESVPDLLISLMSMSLVMGLPRKMHLSRSSSNVPRLPSFLEMPQKPSLFLTFDNVQNPLHLPHETTSERPKVVRDRQRHNGAHFFNISTVLCTFWLGNALRATTCTFSTFQFPKVLRAWCVLHILTWKCASLHNCVQLFISHLASWPRTRPFSEPTFRPSGATNQRKKTQCFATFLPFRAPASSFFSFFLFSDLLYSVLLSDSSHLCFYICSYCWKFDF